MANDEKKKSVAFKAQSSKGENDEDCNEDESDEEMALFVKRFNKFMSKKSYGRKGQYSKKNPSTISILSVVKKVTLLSIVQTRRMTRTRRARKMVTRKKNEIHQEKEE